MKARPLLIGCLALSVASLTRPAEACRFTPLEWQQRVERHAYPGLQGQRKHTTWVRDRDRTFVDDLIEQRFRRGEAVDVVVDFNDCYTPKQILDLLAPFGKVTYVGKLVTFALLDAVRVDDLPKLAARPEVAMVELQLRGRFMNDVSTRAVQSRSSLTYPGTSAQDAGLNGAGVNIAFLDSGVDDGHESLAGKFVAGFDAERFEDTNANGIDDSCEPAPLGNGVCTDPDDEPGNGTTNPDDTFGHGTQVAGTAVGAGAAGRVCRTPDDGSPTNCAGVAPGAGLVDVKVGNSILPADLAEALDWIALNRTTFNIRVATITYALADMGVLCPDDDGNSAAARQVNYVASLGIVTVISHGNAGNCGLAAGTVQTPQPGSASFAVTVGGTDDRGTVARTDDTAFAQALHGPRSDFTAASPNLLALKPDLTAPATGIVTARVNTTDQYLSRMGTSMAAAHVAGAAAVIIQGRPTIDPGSLKDLLRRTADTSHNTAAFPLVDPTWDAGLGAGMLNLGGALAASTTDVKFPTCVGPPGSPGAPCALTPPLAFWNNTADISTATPPQVGVANTITAQVRNNGGVPATVLVNFGVYVFAAGNNQFFHIGSRQVTIPGTTTVPVTQSWTPAATNHQCVQVSIDFGLDTDYTNNVTQRNLSVAPSVYQVRIENPFPVPARIEIENKSDRSDWRCVVSERSFVIDPIQDCPRTIKVTFDPPRGARAGERANCDLVVRATPTRGSDRPRIIGGVTMQTFVPKPCRTVGMVIDARRQPVRGARLIFGRAPREDEKATGGSEDRAAPVLTDEDGIFSLVLTPYVPQQVVIEAAGVGQGRFTVRPECGAGKLTFVLGREGVRLQE